MTRYSSNYSKTYHTSVSLFVRILVVGIVVFFSTVSSSMSMIAPSSRVAVVTGANKGIGYHIALQLASSGFFETVILACRNPSLGKEAVLSMKQQQQQSTTVNADILYMPLEIGNDKSHKTFVSAVEKQFGKVDVLVNNAAMAFKGADPTPFREQCKPTLDVNFRGTADFTEIMLPLLEKGTDARLVNVASMSGYLDQLTSQSLKDQFTSSQLKMEKLRNLVNQFESDVQQGIHVQNGWGNSNYGLSKLALIAATKVWAREYPFIKINCCCPGYCDTDMTSHKGPRPPSEGAKNAVLPATMSHDDCPTGQFFANQKISSW